MDGIVEWDAVGGNFVLDLVPAWSWTQGFLFLSLFLSLFHLLNVADYLLADLLEQNSLKSDRNNSQFISRVIIQWNISTGCWLQRGIILVAPR